MSSLSINLSMNLSHPINFSQIFALACAKSLFYRCGQHTCLSIKYYINLQKLFLVLCYYYLYSSFSCSGACALNTLRFNRFSISVSGTIITEVISWNLKAFKSSIVIFFNMISTVLGHISYSNSLSNRGICAPPAPPPAY